MWLLSLGTGNDPAAYPPLPEPQAVVASDLTLIECDRVLIRAQAIGEISEADAADRRATARV